MLFRRRGRVALQTYGAESLKQKSLPVTVFDHELVELARVMTTVMHGLNGIGLAAVQIGIHCDLIVLDIARDSMGDPPTPGELQLLPQMPLALVNPEIVASGGEIVPYEEGCLSVPELYAPVRRPRVVRVKARDLSGNWLEFEAGGLLARCIQHEIDHLQGVLFVDRLSDEARQGIADGLAGLERRGRRLHFQREMKI